MTLFLSIEVVKGQLLFFKLCAARVRSKMYKNKNRFQLTWLVVDGLVRLFLL